MGWGVDLGAQVSEFQFPEKAKFDLAVEILT